MEEIKISIIVAAYNVEKWLPRCVKSVINQTYKNWELIIINDGSTDETGKIADDFAGKDKRIFVVHQENQGLIEVREKGILLSKGDYVGFVDGDDAVEPFMYERLLKNAIEYDADISHCGLQFFYEGRNNTSLAGTEKIIIQDNSEAIKELLEGNWMQPSLCNKLYKKEILNNSCLDKTIVNNEDLLRNYTLFKRAQKVVYQDFYGYQYWKRENSLSTDKNLPLIMKNILKARNCILTNSDYADQKYALKSWLSAVVNTVNALCFDKNEEAVQLCRQCRTELKARKKDLNLLIRRQKIAALLIIFVPQVHKWTYAIYLKKRK